MLWRNHSNYVFAIKVFATHDCTEKVMCKFFKAANLQIISKCEILLNYTFGRWSTCPNSTEQGNNNLQNKQSRHYDTFIMHSLNILYKLKFYIPVQQIHTFPDFLQSSSEKKW